MTRALPTATTPSVTSEFVLSAASQALCDAFADAAAQAPWQSYICNACGYVYHEADGDPDGGLPPGTRLADIPDDWACPLCGVTKADFLRTKPPRWRRCGRRPAQRQPPPSACVASREWSSSARAVQAGNWPKPCANTAPRCPSPW